MSSERRLAGWDEEPPRGGDPPPTTTESTDPAFLGVRRSRVHPTAPPVFCWHHFRSWEFLGRKYFHSTQENPPVLMSAFSVVTQDHQEL